MQIPGPRFRPLQSCSEDSNAFGNLGGGGGKYNGNKSNKRLCVLCARYLSVLHTPTHVILVNNPAM